ncbi:hypothetical protein [Photobacterium kishitanii]|uniref:Uncharacterized protein n=1 Tax=Photobacterium kishitanii TaxID=318456 RepID=A0A2T3KL08_9GAMM|nr:hypothetical protein [Photobacterium kishitanii]PSV00405.1 hypothetical protein C9J27_04555 [Photobacterium kishitanii]
MLIDTPVYMPEQTFFDVIYDSERYGKTVVILLTKGGEVTLFDGFVAVIDDGVLTIKQDDLQDWIYDGSTNADLVLFEANLNKYSS